MSIRPRIVYKSFLHKKDKSPLEEQISAQKGNTEKKNIEIKGVFHKTYVRSLDF